MKKIGMKWTIGNPTEYCVLSSCEMFEDVGMNYCDP
jgi:hypothetical protein